MDNRKFYTVNEFSEMLGVSAQHIWNLLRKKSIKSLLVGQRRLIPALELERLIDSAE